MRIGEQLPDPEIRGSRVSRQAAPRTPWFDAKETAYDVYGLQAIAKRRGGVFAAGFLSVLIGAVVATHFWPKTFVSTASVLVEPRQAPLESMERQTARNQADTEIALIRSRRVLAAAVDSLDLHVVATDPTDDSSIAHDELELVAGTSSEAGTYSLTRRNRSRVWAAKLVDTDELLATAPIGMPLSFRGIEVTPAKGAPKSLQLEVVPFGAATQELSKRVTVGRVQREVNLVELACKASSPEVARDTCREILRAYTRLRTGLERAEASTTVEFLEGEVARIGLQLSAAEDSLEAYSRRNSVVGLENSTSEEVRYLTDLRSQREQLEVERGSLSDFIARVARGEASSRDLASYPALLRNQAITELLVSLVDLENRRADLALVRSDQNADVAALDGRIAAVNAQLQSMGRSYKEALDTQIASLDEALSSSGARLAKIPKKRMESARLERQVTLLDELYRLLETRLREAEVAEAVNLPNVEVVDPPSFPLEPASPKLPINLALGALFGVIYGGSLVAYRELTDRKVRTRRTVEQETGLPVLSLIPRVRDPGPVLLPSVEALDHELNAEVVPRLGPVVRGADTAPGSGTRADRLRQIALESFRILSTDLRLLGERLDGQGLTTVAITSTSRDEGKTFTAGNLALVKASQGSRTLLIDADMRAGGVSRFFGFETGTRGLSDCLRGDGGPDWNTYRIPGSNLWVIPAGELSPDSARWLESQELDRLFAWARQHFETVIVDTPPLAFFSDAAAVSRCVEGTLLVAREGVTDREKLDGVLDRLDRAGARVLGIVLNGATLEKESMDSYDYGERGTRSGETT